jgi:hypothetical protein
MNVNVSDLFNDDSALKNCTDDELLAMLNNEIQAPFLKVEILREACRRAFKNEKPDGGIR